jgi:hypothetical protein
VWVDVHSYDADTQLVADLLRYEPGGTAHIQYSTDRQGVSANRADNETRVAHPMVNPREVAVRALHQFIGNTMLVEYFGLIGSFHPTEL